MLSSLILYLILKLIHRKKFPSIVHFVICGCNGKFSFHGVMRDIQEYHVLISDHGDYNENTRTSCSNDGHGMKSFGAQDGGV